MERSQATCANSLGRCIARYPLVYPRFGVDTRRMSWVVTSIGGRSPWSLAHEIPLPKHPTEGWRPVPAGVFRAVRRARPSRTRSMREALRQPELTQPLRGIFTRWATLRPAGM